MLLKYEVISSLPSFQPVIYYLVKWCSLPYEDATWELKEDVDEGKVEEFKKIQNRQPRLKRAVSSLLTFDFMIKIFYICFFFLYFPIKSVLEKYPKQAHCFVWQTMDYFKDKRLM